MKHITYDTLYRLWWSEGCTDGDIAQLYEVPKKKVTNLRHTWGVKVPETILKEFEEHCPQDSALRVHSEVSEGVLLSRTGRRFLQRIEELNDLELESVRLELARRYEVFVEAKQEVEFFEVLQKVIAQHWPDESHR